MGSGHFDSLAATWDQDPAKVERARVVAEAIRGAVAIPDGARLLDYGAGTGLLSQELAGDVGPVTLADTSAGMREVLSEKVAAGHWAEASVVDLDLERDATPEGERYDLICSLLVLHHVHALDRVLAAFRTLLAPGGRLVIADLDREDGSFHTHDFDGHHGFGRDELADRLRAAGFAEVEITGATTLRKEGVEYSVFLAVAG